MSARTFVFSASSTLRSPFSFVIAHIFISCVFNVFTAIVITMAEEQSRVEAYRVPKIPPFWKNAPETWFIQVEASLRVANITVDRTKADFLLTGVDHEVVSHVTDLVTADPPLENLYQRLKERILSVYAISPEARLRQLLKGQVLGQQKPSHLLNYMKNLNNGQCSTAVLKSLFIEQLPETHKAILVAANEPDLQKLAEIADRLADINNPSTSVVPFVAPVNKNKQRDTDAPSSIEEKLSVLTKQLASLNREVTKLKRRRSVSRGRSPEASANPKKPDKQSDICFIHRKYGEKATSCRKPCSWQAPKKSEN